MGTMSGRRVGLLGGTFDPPHIGHLVTAVELVEQLDLDLVLLVVAGEPWQKVATRDVTPAADRLAMVAAAVGGLDRVEACDVEVRRAGPTYTVDTVEELRSAWPDDELHLVLGADAVGGLTTWHRWEELRRVPLVVVDRPGRRGEPPTGFTTTRVEVPRLEVSSTDLRRRLAGGRSVRFLVPDPVISVIRKRDLYGVRR